MSSVFLTTILFAALWYALYLWGAFVRTRRPDKRAMPHGNTNTRKRFIITAYLLFVGVACTYVPWKAKPTPQIPERNLGYGWLWSGPSESFWRQMAHPDYGLVGLTIVGVSALAGALFVFLHAHRNQ